MNVVLEIGDMPEWKTVKNMTMFAEEVMPRIKARLARGAADRGGPPCRSAVAR